MWDVEKWYRKYPHWNLKLTTVQDINLMIFDFKLICKLLSQISCSYHDLRIFKVTSNGMRITFVIDVLEHQVISIRFLQNKDMEIVNICIPC